VIIDLVVTGAWYVASQCSDYRVHAKLNAVSSVTHIDYLFSFCAIPYRGYLIFRLNFITSQQYEIPNSGNLETCQDISVLSDQLLTVSKCVTENHNAKRKIAMRWNQIEGDWKPFPGHHAPGEPAHDETQQSAGRREILLGKLQEGFGIAQEEAEKQVDDFGKETRGYFYIF
jgi:uncharacterized protein YjbJ (UPF0337 family)